MPIFKSLVWFNLEKSRCKRDSNQGSSALEADALTTRPTRRYIQRERTPQGKATTEAVDSRKSCMVLWISFPQVTETRHITFLKSVTNTNTVSRGLAYRPLLNAPVERRTKHQNMTYSPAQSTSKQGSRCSPLVCPSKPSSGGLQRICSWHPSMQHSRERGSSPCNHHIERRRRNSVETQLGIRARLWSD